VEMVWGVEDVGFGRYGVVEIWVCEMWFRV
jgi:hypothetical protein